MTFRNLITGAAVALTFAFGTQALAQTDGTAPPSLQSSDFEAAQLDAFAQAYLAVTELRRNYVAQLQDVDSEEDQQRIVEEANTEIIAAVEGVDGVDVETYESIIAVAQNDEDLVERINSRIGALQEQ